jgi:glyoxylase-like metal-dependent hydrolase (beta-lactamase superfamily II)
MSKNPLSRRSFLQATGIVAFGGAFSSFAASPLVPQSKVTITNKDLGGGLILFQGAGCNVVATRSDDGILMIDGGLKENANALLNAVRQATGKSRLQTMINTHWHPDHTGCNEAFGRDGGVIFAHEKTKLYLSNRVTSVTFEGRLDPLPDIARPNKTARLDGSLEFAGRKIDYGYMPAAHTDGDLFLHFADRGVLVAGGVVSGEKWPILDYRNGAWYGGRVRALERLAKVVTPTTQVVPAHGRLITGRDIVRQRDIYDELFKTMIGYMNMGLGAEDVVARKPLSKYDAEFGDAGTFLDGAYRSMQIAYVPD